MPFAELSDRLRDKGANARIGSSAPWALAEEPRIAWSIAMEREAISIFRNEELWTRFPVKIGEPVRAVTSPDGMWFVIEGDRGAILWQRAPVWNGTQPPDPDTIAREIRVRPAN